MKLLLESTSKIVRVDGVEARVWEGRSTGGVEVICFIARIAVAEGQNTEEFDRELQQMKAPSAAAESFPLRMVL